MLRAFAKVSDWDWRESVLERRRSLPEPLVDLLRPEDSMSPFSPRLFRSTNPLAAS